MTTGFGRWTAIVSGDERAGAAVGGAGRAEVIRAGRGERSRRGAGLLSVSLAFAVTAALAACAPTGGSDGPATPAPAASASSASTDGATGSRAITGSITVFAAASLTGSFTDLATAFETAYPGASVALTFAGSSDLVTQISEGAPADVFASADTANMSKLVEQGLVDGEAQPFATNVLSIAVPPSNPADITALDDLARPGVKTVLCAPQVPCGRAAQSVERAAGVDIRPVSEESSVTDVLGKVLSGEADAGLVYVTDVRAAGGKVTGIPFAEASEAVNTYPIATVAGTPAPDVARAFVAFVTGPEGRQVLEAAGFGAP